MKSKNMLIMAVCIMLAVLLLSTVLGGCAQISGETDREPNAAVRKGAGADQEENVSEEDETNQTSEPALTEPAEPYDTYDAYMKFVNGLTDQAKIDLVQSTADSITVVQAAWESKWPDVEENPDALAKVEALGEDMIPYIIRYTHFIRETSPEDQKKAVLLLLCSIAKYETGRQVDRELLPEYPEEFKQYWIEGITNAWAVRFYLWYMSTQSQGDN